MQTKFRLEKPQTDRRCACVKELETALKRVQIWGFIDIKWIPDFHK
jgi:hypothetical protein